VPVDQRAQPLGDFVQGIGERHADEEAVALAFQRMEQALGARMGRGQLQTLDARIAAGQRIGLVAGRHDTACSIAREP
jgi:hypothetical protein